MAKVQEQLKSPQTIETVRAVEGALGKLANQLYEGDVRSRETVKDIREDMLGLSHPADPDRTARPRARGAGASWTRWWPACRSGWKPPRRRPPAPSARWSRPSPPWTSA
ncbi:MAG: hypothetical protein WDN06_21715 [Asticcacaulis sp.]